MCPCRLLGALLLQLGADMLADWLVKGWKTMQRADYFQMAVIFLAIVAWDFVAGVALGIVAACITFAINTSRLRLVKLGFEPRRLQRKRRSAVYQHEQLVRHGQSIQIMWLHSFVFFGSAHRLHAANPGDCRARRKVLAAA